MKKIFAEVGFGNETFLSTEIEEGEREYRIPRFLLPAQVSEVYFRLWVFKKVFVLSTLNGFKIRQKDKNTFKAVVGVFGETD